MNLNLEKPQKPVEQSADENDFPFTEKKENKLPKLKMNVNWNKKKKAEALTLNLPKRNSSSNNDDSLFSIESVVESESGSEETDDNDKSSEISGLSFLNFDLDKTEEKKKDHFENAKEPEKGKSMKKKSQMKKRKKLI